MNYDIKLIGLDLDGTVFNDNKQITNKTIDTIQRAIKKGIIVIPATGRPLAGLPNEFTSIPGVRYALTANGSSIIDLEEHRVIYSNLIDPKNALNILEVILSFDCIVDVFIEGTGYAPKSKLESINEYMHSEIMSEYFKKTRSFFEGNITDFIQNSNKHIEKIQMIFKHISEKNKAIEKLKDFSYITVTSAMQNNLEINAETANKGDGLIHLGKYLGINREQIMACGDSHNDVEMLKAVGLGVAMGNAPKEIQDIADYITLTNEEDGVAYAIDKFVLSKE